MTIRVIVDPDCIFGNTQIIDFPFSPSAISCDASEKDSGWLWIDQNGEGMSYRVEYYINFWSAYEKADQISKQRNPIKSRWEEKKANRLITNIAASRRGTSNCNVFASESETKSCNNCSNRNASVNIGLSGHKALHHCDGDVVGTYRKIIGPTTLNATGSPDFECCN